MSRNSCDSIVKRMCLIVLMILLVVSASRAASYKVIYNFNFSSSTPSSGLVIDAQGNAYGISSFAGGYDGGGSVYELSPTSGYHLLYPFSPHYPAAGYYPIGNLLVDATGNLYGVTFYGGNNDKQCDVHSCGVVYKLSPPSNGIGYWNETVLYKFCSHGGCPDGQNPSSGMTFDSAGNLYGTAQAGMNGMGMVFELSPGSNAGWTQSILYNFGDSSHDGESPTGKLVFDTVGNLYGTTQGGGSDFAGTVFELTQGASGWTETILHSFDYDDGYLPNGVVVDSFGKVYGTTREGGPYTCRTDGCGVVFELSPNLDGSWTDTTIHIFTGGNGAFPNASIVLDSSGNIYGTTNDGGGNGCSNYGCGTVFKLMPGANGQWSQTLFRFSGGTNGNSPQGPVALSLDGSIYGTAAGGGTKGVGVAFQITQ